MVHRPSRAELALALRRYVSRRITNDQLASVQLDWRDRGAVAVSGMAWRLYDDMYSHRAVGRHAITGALRRDVSRWIVFLQSDQEYLWPEYNFVEVSPGFSSILTFGWWGRKHRQRWKEFSEAGDLSVWSFIDQQAELAARSTPRYLANSDA